MAKTKNNLLRVTQMNAIYLDNEIYHSLQQIFQEATRNLPPGFISPFESEINLFLQLLILNNSVIKSGSTFGQQLLSVKYDSISNLQKILYLLVNFLSYIKIKLEWWKPSHEINNTILKLSTIFQLLDIINLSFFLRNGSKPLLIERVLGLNHIYAKDGAQRQFESKYLARELLWNGFIEILMYVLPLVNYHKLKRTFRNLNPLNKKKSYICNRSITMHSKCAYCGENPVLPHHMGCAHIFCYYCLKGNQVADSKFECPSCDYKSSNLICDRVTLI